MDMNNSLTPEPEKDLAQTPTWLVKSIEDFLHLRFELDACANKETAKCNKYYSLVERRQDGLVLPWNNTTYCNPPYSDIQPWINKASIEAQRNGNTSVLLIPDKPETKVTRLCRDMADTIVHMPFRVRFLRPDGSEFRDEKTGRMQGAKFPVMAVLFTPFGHQMPTRDVYYDFRNAEGKQA